MSRRRAVCVLLLVYVTLVALARTVGESYCSLWLPLLRIELTWLLPAGSLRHVALTSREGEHVYAAQILVYNAPSATAERSGGSTIATVSTLTGNALQAPIILLSLILASTNLNLKRKCLAVVVALPVNTVLFSIDVPWLLAAAVDELQRGGTELHDGSTSILMHYANALDHGGRFVLAMLAAVVIIELLARCRVGRCA